MNFFSSVEDKDILNDVDLFVYNNVSHWVQNNI